MLIVGREKNNKEHLCCVCVCPCPHTGQFNSDTNWSYCRPHKVGVQSYKTGPHFRCQLEVAGSQANHNFCLTCYRLEVPTTSFSLLSAYYGVFLNAYNWTARWRDSQGMVQKISKHRSFEPLGVEVCLLPSLWICSYSPTQKLFEPCTLGTFMEASLCRHDW